MSKQHPLPTAALSQVDGLIDLFNETPIMSRFKKAELRERERRRLLRTGKPHPEAWGSPADFDHDEKKFRDFIKDTNHNLEWQCRTVRKAFSQYTKTAEVPAPHFPMRVAVLLRRAGEHQRERDFLAAWCRHFETGPGVTYDKLMQRARKVGALDISNPDTTKP